MPQPDTRRLIPLSRFCEDFGVSRSTAYRLAKAQKIRLMKLGAKTMVDGDSATALHASLPEAALRAAA